MLQNQTAGRRRWRLADKVEETIPSWRDVGAVLDVVRRPKRRSFFIVTFVEERVESLKDHGLNFCGRLHCGFLNSVLSYCS